MKVIITLNELREAVLKVAQDYGQSYVVVRITMEHDQKIILSSYINGFSKWFEADTIDNLVKQMRKEKGEKFDHERIITDAEAVIGEKEPVEEC
jgi:hypothetical protein